MLAFMVHGKPVGQGSMTAVYNRKTQRASIRHVQSLPLMKWRRAIANEAKVAGAVAAGGYVSISIVFGMPRPGFHYGISGLKEKYRYALPEYKDIDKLVRAVCDALSGVAYADDRQIVELHAVRVFSPYTVIQVEYVTRENAERLAAHAQANSGEGQLPMSLLWEEG